MDYSLVLGMFAVIISNAVLPVNNTFLARLASFPQFPCFLVYCYTVSSSLSSIFPELVYGGPLGALYVRMRHGKENGPIIGGLVQCCDP
ncbi:hypothetical protein ACQKWADRAFT_279698 [Trichoderma austrokoningii]